MSTVLPRPDLVGADARTPVPARTPGPARAHRRQARLPVGLKAGIFGVGSALPERTITNHDLEQVLDTTDEWIVRRTGIRERRRLRAGEDLAPLAADACRQALADAGRTPDEVDHVLITTVTPDRHTPGLAPEVARRLGATGAAASDISAACAGFLYGLDQAAALVESGRAEVVVLCAAEALSRITDHTDRGTAVLFGDGAGAVVVAAGELELGCGGFVLGADGSQVDLLYADTTDRKLRMRGQEVYRHAVRRMTEATRGALERVELGVEDVDLLVAHQANRRIIEAVAADLGVDSSKVVLDMDRAANTSSASIPLALHRAEREGVLQPGMTVAIAAFGAGLVWGAGVVGWKERIHACA